MKTEISLDPGKLLYSIQELKDSGLSYYRINQLVKNGMLEKLNRKFYENTGYDGPLSDFCYAYAYAPKGVVCLMSAAVHYGLTTFIPKTIDIAIPRKEKVSTKPCWPQINIVYFNDERFNAGIETIEKDGNVFRIYDIEKTVADIVSYRDRIGIDETKEILVNYLSKNDRNLNKLIRYAEELKCGDLMKLYLEILV